MAMSYFGRLPQRLLNIDLLLSHQLRGVTHIHRMCAVALAGASDVKFIFII